MPLARYQFTITDENGNVVPNAYVEVKREIPGQPIIPLYLDRSGTAPLGNPFQADAEGFAAFHVGGGAYQVRAYAAGFDRIWRYVAIGTAQEMDREDLVGINWTGDWDSDAVYEVNDAVRNGASSYICTVAHEASEDYDEPGVGDDWDDYWDRLAIGGGDVLGPDGGVVNAEIAVFDQATGKVIKGGGTTIASLTASIINTVRDGVSSAYDTLAELASAVTGLLGRTLTAGNGLTGGGDLGANRSFAVGQGTGIVVNVDDVAVDKASDASVRAAASNKVITSDLIESASAFVALTDAGPVAVDWDTGVNFSLTVTSNRAIGNPTNGQPGTWRTILVQGNDGTDRTITFGNQFLGEIPTITDCDSGKWYLLMVLSVTSTHFVVSAKVAKS